MSKSSNITREAVLAALSKVMDPELKKDLVSLNMIQDLQILDSTVQFRLVLTTPACPLREYLQNESHKAVMSVPGVEHVEIKVDAQVRSDHRERSMLKLPVRNVVAIGSGKGGVGKTTVSVNVAVALAQSGASVGLLDADIYGPNVPTMMGITQLPSMGGETIVPAEAYGVKVMSIGLLVKPDQPLIWRGPILHRTIQQFLGDVEWGELDYLIVDLPPGTGDVQLSLVQSISLSGSVIVTLPQRVSLEDAGRGIQMFKQMDTPVLGVIENMSYLELPDGTHMDVFGNGGGKTLAEHYCVPFLGEIPMDPIVRIGSDQGKPVVVSSPGSASAKALRLVAETLAGQMSVAASLSNAS